MSPFLGTGHNVSGEVTAVGDETECAFCGRRSSDPIFILGRSFCQECEERLARLQVDDPDYPVWLDVIRGIWANWAETL